MATWIYWKWMRSSSCGVSGGVVYKVKPHTDQSINQWMDQSGKQALLATLQSSMHEALNTYYMV